jgi:23S rRNA (uracil1939-C5)-methyltransferase
MRRKNVFLDNIEVLDFAAEGKALARHDGKVIFIEGAIPGDVVNIQLTKSKKDWAEAKVVKLVKASVDRVTPFCTHFGNCGGCKWQMLPYNLQIQFKQNEVEQNLKRLGKVELPTIAPILGSEKTTAYRNKLEFTFSNKRYRTKEEVQHIQTKEELYNLPQESALGFHVPKLFDKVLRIEECFLMEEPTNAIRNAIKDFALQMNFAFYDIKNHTGWLRNLMLRIATTGEIMLNVILAHDSADKTILLDYIQKTFPQITALLYTINAKLNDSIYDLTPIVYHGKNHIIEKLHTGIGDENYQFKISAKSFFQTNTKQAERLYQVTRDFAELTGKETVYDLYCGTGSIGIFCSALAQKIIGVELIEEAIVDAKENAALNAVNHAQFFAGDVIDICNADFFALHGTPDVIITDPPRAGMHTKLVEKIIEMQAPIVVYVSCNSATQARDLQLLDALYQVTKVQPVDMFPHTHHIENVVQLKLR